MEMVEGLVEHPDDIMISISSTGMWAVFYNLAWHLKSFSSLTTYLDPPLPPHVCPDTHLVPLLWLF